MESQKKIYNIAFTGGGTGGHIYPGLAIISFIQKQIPYRIFWIGFSSTDRKIVEEAGIDFYSIPSGKLRRNFSLKNVIDIFKVMAGYVVSRKILKKERPLMLFSKGGFVSVPPVIAAASLKIPVFSHESDLSPGLATKINLRFTEKHFIPYMESLHYYSRKYREKIDVSGNPVRLEFQSADSSKGRGFLGLNKEQPLVLVLGGSSGSLEINRLVRESLLDITAHYTVVHQTGPNEGITLEPAEKYKPYVYLREELPHIIAAADLIICRGGAGTIWECAFLDKPMIIIPLMGKGTRGDQVENARIFERAGIAINLSDNKSAQRLVSVVAGFASGELALKKADKGILKKQACEYIAERIIENIRR